MFSSPEKNIELFALDRGETVVDLGVGAGFYAIAAARAVGPTGFVYAVDIQKNLLEKITKEALREDINNIEVVWGDLEKEGGSHIGDSKADAVILSNVLFQIKEKKVLMEDAYRILRKGGKILLVDWSDSFGGLGPKPNDIVSSKEAKSLAEETGFLLEREIPAGEHHYGFVFRKT